MPLSRIDSPWSLAILGTRGVPARYGGFETFAEELGRRLVQRGWAVTVFSRAHAIEIASLTRGGGRTTYGEIDVALVPSVRQKHLETPSHTLLSSLALLGRRPHVVLLCNSGNAPLIPLLRQACSRVVVNVDGCEWDRRKWGPVARAWHRGAARLATRWADELVADARATRELWARQFGRTAEFIPYGSPSGPVASWDAVHRLGLEPRRYVLYVARLELENNPELVVEAFSAVRTDLPLVVVGHAPYASRLGTRLRALASADPRVMLAGGVYGLPYRELQSHATCYVQASEVGGTHPALLEAMGYGGVVIANDIPAHREVIGDAGLLYRFNDARALASRISTVLGSPALAGALRDRARARLREGYDWDHVTDRYEAVLRGGARPVLRHEAP